MNALTILTFTLGFIAFQMVCAEQKETPQIIAKKCSVSTEVNPTDVTALQKGDFSKPNEKIECYAKCILDHSEYLEEGMIRENFLSQKLSGKYSKSEIDKANAACRGTTGNDHCQVAYNLIKCYNTNKIKLI